MLEDKCCNRFFFLVIFLEIKVDSERNLKSLAAVGGWWGEEGGGGRMVENLTQCIHFSQKGY